MHKAVEGGFTAVGALAAVTSAAEGESRNGGVEEGVVDGSTS